MAEQRPVITKLEALRALIQDTRSRDDHNWWHGRDFDMPLQLVEEAIIEVGREAIINRFGIAAPIVGPSMTISSYSSFGAGTITITSNDVNGKTISEMTPHSPFQQKPFSSSPPEITRHDRIILREAASLYDEVRPMMDWDVSKQNGNEV